MWIHDNTSIGHLLLHIYHITQHHIFYFNDKLKHTLTTEAWVCCGAYVAIQSTVYKQLFG
jgi:hypothetical protein